MEGSLTRIIKQDTNFGPRVCWDRDRICRIRMGQATLSLLCLVVPTCPHNRRKPKVIRCIRLHVPIGGTELDLIWGAESLLLGGRLGGVGIGEVAAAKNNELVPEWRSIVIGFQWTVKQGD